MSSRRAFLGTLLAAPALPVLSTLTRALPGPAVGGRVHSPICEWEFGDVRCGIDSVEAVLPLRRGPDGRLLVDCGKTLEACRERFDNGPLMGRRS